VLLRAHRNLRRRFLHAPLQEETFGPILAVQTVDHADEAVRRANDSPFTLAASVWTSDNAHGRAIASRLRAGAVMVNDAISYFAIAEAPHGAVTPAAGDAPTVAPASSKWSAEIRRRRRPAVKRKALVVSLQHSLTQAADDFLRYEFGGLTQTKIRPRRPENFLPRSRLSKVIVSSCA